jgi:hypothetical protein
MVPDVVYPVHKVISDCVPVGYRFRALKPLLGSFLTSVMLKNEIITHTHTHTHTHTRTHAHTTALQYRMKILLGGCLLAGGHTRRSTTTSSWPEFASEPYRQSDLRLLAKLVPTPADTGCHVVSMMDPYGRILDFLDRTRRSIRIFIPNSAPKQHAAYR